jgi:hypothetical protein
MIDLPVIDTIKIKGYDFVLTCQACPEQYDVLKDGKQVCYVRLRHGRLLSEYPDVFGKGIYWHYFDENFLGIFPTEESRMYHLEKIADRITVELDNEKLPK